MVYRRVQGGLVVETNKQFESETRQLFVPLLFKRAILDRVIYDFFPNKNRVSINDDLAREYQFAMIKRAVYRFFQLSGDAILDFKGIVDAGNYRLNPWLQMLGNGMSNVPYLVSKKYNGFAGIFKNQIRGGRYRIHTNPWTISEVQLSLCKTGLFDSLSSQRLGMCSGECHQSTLGRGVLDQFRGLFSRLLHLCYLIAHGFVLPKHYVPLSSHFVPRAAHLPRLTLVDQPSKEHYNQLQNANASQDSCKPCQFPLSDSVFVGCSLAACSCMVISCRGTALAFRWKERLRGGWHGLCGWSLITASILGLGCALSTIGLGGPFVFWRFRWLLGEDDYCNNQPSHSGSIVN